VTAQPEDSRYADLSDLLRRRSHLRLVSAEGETADVPEELAEKIGEVVTVLAQGRQVTVFADETLISTTKAAEILGVSRQTIVRFVESGRLRYSQPGVHRRLRLSDVLEEKRRREEFREAMDQFRAEAIDDGTYGEPVSDADLALMKQVRKELAEERRSRGEV
jgi:excisionase family DNA binding protein